MKLKKNERTFFEKNPIQEVIAQIRFPRNMEIETGLPVAFQKELANDFPLLEVQEQHSVSFAVGNNPTGDQVVRQKEPPVFNFISENKELRVSLTSSYIALTCVSYKSWEIFFEHLEDSFAKLNKFYPTKFITRVGLRYRNLIDKHELGIPDKNWTDLIDPHIIGHLGFNGLFEGNIDKSTIMAANSITRLKLDEFSLTLQTGLADKNGKTCFFIDADYYNEFSKKADSFSLKKEFEVLHEQSSSVFGNCIRPDLAKALKPIQKS